MRICCCKYYRALVLWFVHFVHLFCSFMHAYCLLQQANHKVLYIYFLIFYLFPFQEAKDPFEKAVLDGRQLALKVKKKMLITYQWTCMCQYDEQIQVVQYNHFKMPD